MGTIDRDGGPMTDNPEDEPGAIDQAEAYRGELDQILTETNQKVEDDDVADKRSTIIAPDAAEYFGDPLPGKPGDPTPYVGALGVGTLPPPATLVLEKIRIALRTHVSPAVLSQMKFDQKYDPITDKIMMELGMYLFSNKIHTETTKKDYPAGWFQGFKESLFPGWLKNRFPVKYTQIFEEVKTVHICPHLNYRTRDEERFHLQFLMPEGDLTRYQS